MSQPVKLSDELVLDARIAGKAQERSIAGQVEFWAKLGRSMELLLNGRQVLSLHHKAGRQSLVEALASVESPEGRKRVADVLATRPYPHYQQCSGKPGLLLRIEEDGTETVGRFVNRTFTAVELTTSQKSQSVPNGRAQSTQKTPRTKVASPRPTLASTKEQKAWA